MTPDGIRTGAWASELDVLVEIAAQVAELVLVGKSLEEKFIDFLATQPETEEARR